MFIKFDVFLLQSVLGGIWNLENQICMNSPINQPKFLKNVWNNFWVKHFSNSWRYVCCRWFFFSLFVQDWGMLYSYLLTTHPYPFPPFPTYESLTRKALAGMWRWWKWANRLAAPSWLIQGTGRLELSTMVQFFGTEAYSRTYIISEFGHWIWFNIILTSRIAHVHFRMFHFGGKVSWDAWC